MQLPAAEGLLNFCKPLGWTSHDVVQLVRRRLGQRRVGHAGTLDPAATGVLPICLGRATRLADRVGAGTKVYAADIVLGHATDTGDAEGRLLTDAQQGAAAASGPSLEAVLAALATQVGAIEQVPPAYSALKVAGEAAYARARRGETVTLPTRRVTVYGIALLAWRPPRLSVVLRCSTGTYVRAIARDVGAALGQEAHLDALVRLAVGGFTLDEAVSVERFERAVADGTVADLIQAPDRAVLDLPAAVLGRDTERFFGHGRAWRDPAGRPPREARAYATDGRFLGLLRADAEGSQWQPALSFVYDAGATGEN